MSSTSDGKNMTKNLEKVLEKAVRSAMPEYDVAQCVYEYTQDSKHPGVSTYRLEKILRSLGAQHPRRYAHNNAEMARLPIRRITAIQASRQSVSKEHTTIPVLYTDPDWKDNTIILFADEDDLNNDMAGRIKRKQRTVTSYDISDIFAHNQHLQATAAYHLRGRRTIAKDDAGKYIADVITAYIAEQPLHMRSLYAWLHAADGKDMIASKQAIKNPLQIPQIKQIRHVKFIKALKEHMDQRHKSWQLVGKPDYANMTGDIIFYDEKKTLERYFDQHIITRKEPHLLLDTSKL